MNAEQLQAEFEKIYTMLDDEGRVAMKSIEAADIIEKYVDEHTHELMFSQRYAMKAVACTVLRRQRTIEMDMKTVEPMLPQKFYVSIGCEDDELRDLLCNTVKDILLTFMDSYAHAKKIQKLLKEREHK